MPRLCPLASVLPAASCPRSCFDSESDCIELLAGDASTGHCWLVAVNLAWQLAPALRICFLPRQQLLAARLCTETQLPAACSL